MSFRQTNCIWIAFIALLSAVRIIESKKDPQRTYFLKDYLSTATLELPTLIKNLWPYALVFEAVFIFLIWNKGIVIGKDYSERVIQRWCFEPCSNTTHPSSILFSSLRYRVNRFHKHCIWINSQTIPNNQISLNHKNSIIDNWNFSFSVACVHSFLHVILTHSVINRIALNIYSYSQITDITHSTFGKDSLNSTHMLDTFTHHCTCFVSRYTFKVWVRALYSLLIKGQCASMIEIVSLIGATCAVLIPTPLMEFRYYTIPLFFFFILSTKKDIIPTKVEQKDRLRIQKTDRINAFKLLIQFIVVNTITICVFLYRPFTWVMNPSKQQRFMW